MLQGWLQVFISINYWQAALSTQGGGDADEIGNYLGEVERPTSLGFQNKKGLFLLQSVSGICENWVVLVSAVMYEPVFP